MNPQRYNNVRYPNQPSNQIQHPNQQYNQLNFSNANESSEDESTEDVNISQELLLKILKDQRTFYREIKGNQVPKMKVQEYDVIINSIDRDWYNNADASQYNFGIKFGTSSNKMESLPLYNNNPTIPATVAQSRAGNRGDTNTSGWTLNGVSYSAYNSTQGLGAIVGYENIIIQGEKMASVINEYKNIVYLIVLNAIFPSRNRKITYTTTNTTILHNSYINLTVDEINNIQRGTNSHLDSSIAILVPFSPIPDSSQQIKFVEFKNINQTKKHFSIPLSSLNKLTFKCRDNLGQIIQNVNDTLEIKYAYYNQSDGSDATTEFVVIQTTKYFSASEFVAGDKILIKNYTYRNQDNDQAGDFEKFMNREQGHYIISINVDDGTKKLKNRIFIPKPSSLSTTSGALSDELWYTAFKTKGFTNDPSTISTDDSDGKIINVNMQNTYIMKIGVLEKNMDILRSQII